MTTLTGSYDITNENNTSGTLKTLLLLSLIMLGIFLVTGSIDRTVSPPTHVDVIETVHATKKHGVDAQSIRQCLKDKGASQLWLTRSNKWHNRHKYFRTCNLPDGRIGVQIVKWSWTAGAWREVTAYVIKDGRPAQVVEYLSARATLVKP